MGQIVSGAAKPKRCNIQSLSQLGTPTAGEYILVSSDNSMNAAGKGNFDTYMVGDGHTAATELEFKPVNDFAKITLVKGKNLLNPAEITTGWIQMSTGSGKGGYNYRKTPFIPVSENGLFFNKSYTNSGSGIGGAVYDSSQTYIRALAGKVYTYVEGDAYVRWTMLKSSYDAGELQIEEGTTGTAYEAWFAPYPTLSFNEDLITAIDGAKINNESVALNKLGSDVTEYVNSKNLCDPEKYILGRVINSNGGVSAVTDSYAMYSYLPVKPLTQYHLSNKNGNGLYGTNYTEFYIAFYDESKVLIPNSVISQRTQQLTTPAGCYYMSVSVNPAVCLEPQIEEGTTRTSYEEYFAPRKMFLEELVPIPSETITTKINDELSNKKIYAGGIEISLPDKIFAVVGDTLQVFYQGFAKCVDIENYNVLITCSKGKQYHRYFEYTPSASDVGTTTFGVAIYDNNRNLLGSASCTLVTLAQPSSPSSEKKFMCVGDSLTANGIWVAEAYRRLTGSGGTPAGLNLNNITFGGSKTKDGAGYIGMSGWSWYNFVTNSRAAFRFTLSGSPSLSMGAVYSNNGHNYEIIEIIDNTILCGTSSTSNTPSASGTLTKVSGGGDASLTFSSAFADAANPFWDGSKVSFTTYVNNYLGGSVEYVYTLLSWNGMGGTISSIMESVKTFADALHRDYPNAKLRLMGLQFPSMKLMMPVYGAIGSGYADTYAMYIKAIELQEAFKEFANSEGYSTWVEYINVAAEFDSEYNMPITEKNVNTRNSSHQEPYANNGVHPSNAGYLQIGDVAYRSIVNDLLLE